MTCSHAVRSNTRVNRCPWAGHLAAICARVLSHDGSDGHTCLVSLLRVELMQKSASDGIGHVGCVL